MSSDETEGGRCRVISKRRLFGGTFLYRSCDDRPAAATAPSQETPQVGRRAILERGDILPGGPTIHGDPVPTLGAQAEVASDDDTDGGRCRVISKRRLFGGTFMHRKCDDSRPGART